MTNNFFEPQEINLQTQPLPTYIDSDGVFKINTPMLSTYNFDGLIPKYDGPLSASAVKPGYLIQLDAGGQYYPVVSVESDDDVLDNTGIVTINYIDNLGNTESESYAETDQVNVIYENWDEKIVGSQGWGITSGGNAIFTNVAVRGDLEASTLDVGGVNGITYDGSTVIIGADVVVNAPIEFNGVTQEQLDSELAGYIPDGGAAGDIVSTNTKITGGNIETGIIRSTGYQGPGTGSAFSTIGMLINLDNGGIASKNFRVDPQGNAEFRGSITGSQIIGSSFQTATSGRRIQMDTAGGYNNRISLYSQDNILAGTIGGDSYIENGITYSRVGIIAQTGNRAIFSLDSRSGGDGRVVLGDFDSDTNAIVTRTNLGVAGSIVSGASFPVGSGGGSILCYGNITAIGPGKFFGDGSELTGIASTSGYRNAGSNGGGTAPIGGNKITFSAGAPPGSGRTTGDVHLRYT